MFSLTHLSTEGYKKEGRKRDKGENNAGILQGGGLAGKKIGKNIRTVL